MPIDYTSADRFLQLSFGKFDKPSAKIGFPKIGTLSRYFVKLLDDTSTNTPTLSHQHCPMLASASVEMWHRAIHSFLWSVALTETSPLWASVSGYYSSHFVMRAFAHSMGIFKSFTQRATVQVVSQGGQFVCNRLSDGGGEHSFYWKAVKGHPKLVLNPLFRENNERQNKRQEDQSDAMHRTFANYADHLDSFTPLQFSTIEMVSKRVERISRIRRHSVTAPTPQRDDFPDIDKVQILAFQRVVAFHDFLEENVPKNRFWQAHRRPSWCKDIISFQVEDQGLEQPLAT